MTLIRALPSSYANFASLLQLLDKLDKDTLQAAFINEEALRSRTSTPGTTAVLSASTSQAPATDACAWCELPGHTRDQCFRFKRDQQKAAQEAQEKKKSRGKNKAKATPTQATAAAAQETATEFAGQASVRRSAHSTAPEHATHLLWTADTGATSHMTPHKHWLRNYAPLRVAVRLANDDVVYSEGVGVLHVPELGSNLFSVLYLARHRGFTIHIHSDRMGFDREGHTLFCAKIGASNTAYLDGKVVSAPQAALSASASTLPLDESLWHRRFAHTHLQSIRDLAKGQLVSGMRLDSKQEADPICEPCLSGKLNAAPFPSSTSRASNPLKFVHSDVHGPLPVRTASGYRYWITFIDDSTRLRSVILLKTKGEATSAFKQFKAFAENETNERIGTLRDDKGGEYMSKELEDFCNEHGIQRQHTFYNPSTKKAIISERAIFDERYLPGLKNWPNSVPSATHPPLHQVSIPASPEFHFVSPSEDAQQPRLGGEGSVDPQPEPAAPPPPQDQSPAPEPAHSPSPVRSRAPSPSPARSPPPPAAPPARGHAPSEPQAGPSGLQREPSEPSLAERRPKHNVKPPGEWWKVQPAAAPEPAPQDPIPEEPMEDINEDQEVPLSDASTDELCLKASSGQNTWPATYGAAMKRNDAEDWRAAAQAELDALIANGTWEPCPLPPGKKAIGNRWVFTQKFLTDGELERYKARLVIKGYAQRPGLDYFETFAPTVPMASVRVTLCLSALEDLYLRSLDISNAYTNGVLKEEVYMQQPEGFHFGKPGWVLRLCKALYGLKQAGNVWNKTLHATLRDLGFTRLKSDPSLYLYRRGNIRIIVPVFIDDITIASNDAAEANRFLQELSMVYKLRDLGDTSALFGIAITRDRPNRRNHALPATTPMSPDRRLSSADCPSTPAERTAMQSLPYINAVGSLMFLATCTRPDIAYTVSVLARFNSNPGQAHWQAVKHLFRYLKGTQDLQLTYCPAATKELFVTYSDSDYAGDSDTLRSTGAYVVMMGTGAVDWSSKLQGMVTHSTTEAEYVAANQAGRDIMWMRNLLEEFGYNLSESPSTLFMDNNSAIAVAKNPEHFGRLKHIQLRLYWLRDVVEQGLINPQYVQTDWMLADVLTKALPPVKVTALRRLLGLE
ncbi:polyprotein [Phanerochaete sordida]|uniref:Polyprotein n=1 Tax=Phanerochaete sordida TaxID=48140 RepID=A0A9P3LMT9_9APHY|nr:polyprotein [Phanerochaete sordida]